MKFRCAALFVTAFSIGACTEAPTQFVVVVDSDLEVPTELQTVRATVRNGSGDVRSEFPFELRPPGAPDDATRYPLPLSFAVVEPESGYDDELVIELRGEGPTRDVVRRAVTRFVPGRTLELPMFLARQCTTLSCDPGETCTEFGCRSEQVDPNGLRQIEAGQENLAISTPDAGPIDAGSTDLGPADLGGTDLGPADQGPPDLGPEDLGPEDLGPGDSGPPDLGPMDLGAPDMGPQGPTCDPLEMPDLQAGIFVAPAPVGNDGLDGRSPLAAVATLDRAVQVAQSVTDPKLYLATGVYREVLDLSPLSGSVQVSGGWQGTTTWSHGCGPTERGKTLVGPLEPTAIRIGPGSGVTALRLDRFTVRTKQTCSAGESCIAIHLRGAQLEMEDMDVEAGRGGDGAPGVPGMVGGTRACNRFSDCLTSGPPTPGQSGARGSDGVRGSFGPEGYRPGDGQEGQPGGEGDNGTRGGPGEAAFCIFSCGFCASGCANNTSTIEDRADGGECGCGGLPGTQGTGGGGGGASVSVLVSGTGAGVDVAWSRLATAGGGDGASGGGGGPGGMPDAGMAGDDKRCYESPFDCRPVAGPQGGCDFCKQGGASGNETSFRTLAGGSAGGAGAPGGKGGDGGGGSGGSSYGIVKVNGATASLFMTQFQVGPGGSGAGAAPDGVQANQN